MQVAAAVARQFRRAGVRRFSEQTGRGVLVFVPAGSFCEARVRRRTRRHLPCPPFHSVFSFSLSKSSVHEKHRSQGVLTRNETTGSRADLLPAPSPVDGPKALRVSSPSRTD